jgi:hypothetical protein
MVNFMQHWDQKMNIKYTALIVLITCYLNAEQQDIFAMPSKRDEFYDEQQTCKKVNLWGQKLRMQDAASEEIKQSSSRYIDYEERCIAFDQIVSAEVINLLNQEIAKRDRAKELFKSLEMHAACQCMDRQKKDLVDALAHELGSKEKQEIKEEQASEGNNSPEE